MTQEMITKAWDSGVLETLTKHEVADAAALADALKGARFAPAQPPQAAATATIRAPKGLLRITFGPSARSLQGSHTQVT